jgi:two-component sensor histidine kinase
VEPGCGEAAAARADGARVDGAPVDGAPVDGGGDVLLVAPLEGDLQALARAVCGLGLTPRPARSLEAVATALADGALDLCFVAVTEEAASAAVGEALVASYESEPRWAHLPVVFLVKDANRPPPALALLARVKGQPPLVLLERPVRERALRSVFDVQRQVRARQFETRDLLEELRAAERRQSFLLSELRHRTRNSMAVLQAMFRLTARRHTDHATFLKVFSDRLNSLAAAHGRLSDERSQERNLSALVREHALPYAGDGARLSLDGPDVVLSTRIAFDLALVLHELATNAAKYGALSVPQGHVDFFWRVGPAEDGEASLELVWRERDGPEIAKPERRGLGSELIENLAGGTGASSGVDYRSDGLVWTARIPSAHFTLAAEAPEGPREGRAEGAQGPPQGPPP